MRRHVHGHGAAAADPAATRSRMRAGTLSAVVSVLVLGVKFTAWRITQSQAVFSDAMESIVNVAAAAAALGALAFAARPADDNHPYGHGKAEFLTAGFEGGLVAFAALVILYEGFAAFFARNVPRELDLGIAVLAGAGAVNLFLGLHLLRTGRRLASPALVADAQHVLSDVWTSAGAVVGLFLVLVTGLTWFDPLTAVLVALQLLWTGAKLLRESARGLLDERDPVVLAAVAEVLEGARRPGVIEVHDVRVINTGGHHHVDLHVVVPEFWTVERAHEEMDAYEHRVQELRCGPGELQFHVDPCERAYCRRCDYPECPVRREDFEGRRPMTAETVVAGPEPTPAPAGDAERTTRTPATPPAAP